MQYPYLVDILNLLMIKNDNLINKSALTKAEWLAIFFINLQDGHKMKYENIIGEIINYTGLGTFKKEVIGQWQKCICPVVSSEQFCDRIKNR